MLSELENKFIFKRLTDKLWIINDTLAIIYYYDLDDFLIIAHTKHHHALYYHYLEFAINYRVKMTLQGK